MPRRNKQEGIVSILTLPEVKKAGLSARQSMQEQLKGLYSNEYLNGLDNDQIYDLFEGMILLLQPQHIKHEKPVKPRPGSNIYDLPIEDQWWLIKPEEPEEEA